MNLPKLAAIGAYCHDMRITKLQFATTAAIAALAIYTVGSHTARVHAQAGCNAGTLQGTYVYTSSGYYGLPQGVGFFAAAGKLTFNGDGTFSSLDTASSNGTVQRNRALNGIYTVGVDCRGTATFLNPTSNVDFILSSSGQTANFVGADSGTVVAGTATLQVLPQ